MARSSPNNTVPEVSVFAALPIDDADDIELHNCRALDPTTNQPVSLLSAAPFNPVLVTGTINPLPRDKQHHYIKASDRNKTHHVQISVTRNAFGEYDDGTLGLWVAGETGWYLVQSAKDYKDTMSFMKEDVRIFYFVVDAYKPKKRRRGNHATPPQDYSARELFAKYASEVIKDAAAVLKAADQIHAHCEFLLSSMVARKENIAWSKNPLYLHLKHKFPEVLATIRQRLLGPEAVQFDADASSKTSASKWEPNAHASMDVIALASSTSSAKGTRGRPHRSAECPPNLTARTRRGATSPAPATPDQIHGQDRGELSDRESDEEPQAAHKGKSALRPRPSKGPINMNSPTGPSGTADSDVEDEPSRSYRTAQTAGKRKHDDTPSDLRHSKRRPSRLHIDEGIDMPSSPASSDAVSGADAAETPPPAPADASEADLAIRLNHHPDPLQQDTWICALEGCMHKVYLASKPDSQQLIKDHFRLHIFDDDERVKLVKKLQAPSLPVRHLMERVRLQAAVDGIGPSTAGGSYVGPGGILGSQVAGSRFPDPVLRRL